MTTQGQLEALFDPRSAVVTLPIAPGQASALFPEERAAIANATPGRRDEFAAGRRCAALAMTRLGCRPGPVAMGSDRAPIWPEGLIGSIAHSQTMAAAVVARQADGIRSIGLDLEPALPLPDDLFDTILRPGEQDRLAQLPEALQPVYARLIFSAKEALFKCQYGISRSFIDFYAAEISLDLRERSFRAVLVVAAGVFPAGQSFSGRFHLDADLIATGVMLGN